MNDGSNDAVQAIFKEPFRFGVALFISIAPLPSEIPPPPSKKTGRKTRVSSHLTAMPFNC